MSRSMPRGAELAAPTGCRAMPTSGKVAAEENKRTAPQQAVPVPQHDPLQPPNGAAGMLSESTERNSVGAVARSASADLSVSVSRSDNEIATLSDA